MPDQRHVTDDKNTQAPLVRPYAMTGGRTRPRYQLAIEALVSTTASPAQLTGLLPEHRRICDLCREVKSVAEVSALLAIPLGVARILVADLAEAGLVSIHQPGGDENAGGMPDVSLLERVLSGLRALDVPAAAHRTDTLPPASAAAERNPEDDHRALVDDLDDVIDTEAGLQEVLLQARYDDAVEDLTGVLDVDAGLLDILRRRTDLDT